MLLNPTLIILMKNDINFDVYGLTCFKYIPIFVPKINVFFLKKSLEEFSTKLEVDANFPKNMVWFNSRVVKGG